jgi:imidazolonepropionase-like amidohydrolase
MQVQSILSTGAAALFIITLLLGQAAAQDRVLIKGGRVIPVSGPEIEGGSVLIEHGKVVAVGKDVDSPYDAKIIDATGKVVFPGLVEAHFTRGMDRPNEAYPVTPFLSVVDSLDPASVEFEEALRDGVTTLHVIHGNAQPVAGRGMVVRPVGRIVDNMAVLVDGALKMSFIPRQFSSHVAQYAEMRRVFAELQDYMNRIHDKLEDDEESKKQQLEDEKKKGVAKKDEKPQAPKEAREEEAIDRRKRTLVEVTKGRVPVFMACNAAEIPYALDFAKKNGFYDRTTLVLGADAWKMADVVAASGRPVVLDVDLMHRERDPITGKEIETAVAPVFARKGIKFALQTARTAFSQKLLCAQAATAVRSGLDRDAAIKAITQWPAEMIGLGDRVGSIEKGRDGNILILSGDPLSTTTVVEKVVIEGALAYERDKDERLQRILNISEETKQGAASRAESKPASTPRPGDSTDGAKSGDSDKKEDK